ncbi:MAG: DUF2071 domain-containing protein [Planctomycetota bacterium]
MTRTSDGKVVGGGSSGVYTLKPPTGPCVMRQAWRDLLFLHWEFDPGLIQDTLPTGLRVDTLGGRAYVGVVPFQMDKVRPRFCPPVPGVSWFGELNLRTYVVGPDGRPGVWFYSLDAHQRLAVWLARKFFSLPYYYARIEQREWPDPGRGRKLEYFWERGPREARPRRGAIKGTRGRRRPVPRNPPQAPAGPAFVYRTPPTSAAKLTEAGTLAHWLVERYLLYSRRPLFVPDVGRTAPRESASVDRGEFYVGRVEHKPYAVAEVQVAHADPSLFGLNGFDVPTPPPTSALWSPGVGVSIHPLRKVCAQTSTPT